MFKSCRCNMLSNFWNSFEPGLFEITKATTGYERDDAVLQRGWMEVSLITDHCLSRRNNQQNEIFGKSMNSVKLLV